MNVNISETNFSLRRDKNALILQRPSSGKELILLIKAKIPVKYAMMLPNAIQYKSSLEEIQTYLLLRLCVSVEMPYLNENSRTNILALAMTLTKRPSLESST